MTDTAHPLIKLCELRKVFHTGGAAVEVLRGVTLSIRAGEFLAIMGASGSGKSTLMNLLGLLDRPSSGCYRFAGRDVTHLGEDERAALRRHAFGFIFQQYNLIPTATALENVEMPAMYAGASSEHRRKRACSLLERLGLGDRLGHRPSQLSGGQQQRVSIARALINGGSVILADEPTGALDSTTSAEVMALLSSLAAQGHTIILVTHDRAVAEAADRIVEIADGTIVSDTVRSTNSRLALAESHTTNSAASLVADAGEALRQGRRSLAANPIRTALTLTGIIIGVASVIALMAIGEGTKQTVLEQLAAYGTNRLYVTPGSTTGRGPGGTLSMADVDLVRGVPNVAASMPFVQNRVTVRYGNVDARVPAAAVTPDYPQMLNWPIMQGAFFTESDERGLATVAVIGQKLRRTLFPDGADPLRKFILVNDIPFRVVGVLSEKGAASGDSDDDNTIAIPFSTGSQRLFGSPYLSWISVLVSDIDKAQQTTDDITALLTASHRTQDFSVYNRAASIAAEMKTQSSLTLLLGFTAAISLLVGGIGVMNMMLMSVAERTREIGIRIAMGARTGDIMRQFLTEALMLTAIGGCLGFLLGHLAGVGAAMFGMRVIFTAHAAVAALLCSIAAGLIFGFMPARRAARLDPVVALARE